eukprot:GGOE01045331.1.p1 GENE.GGOE01045331.1~~GGOE01045331.1.p1  ORF type:complete len:120 (-),score=7.84 GGOE01045331.1:120-479(-)
MLDVPPTLVGPPVAIVTTLSEVVELLLFCWQMFLPRFAGRSLTPTQLDLTRQIAQEERVEVVSALNAYLTQSTPFCPAMFHQKGDPVSWWLAAKMSGFPTSKLKACLCLCGLFVHHRLP